MDDDESCFVRPAPVDQRSLIRAGGAEGGDIDTDGVGSSDCELKKKILTASDMIRWQKSTGYQHLISFIKQLNHFATGKQNGVHDYHELTDERLIRVRNLLQRLSQAVDEIKPFVDDKNQRFGNKAYRLWFERMKSIVNDYLKEEEDQHEDASEGQELGQYLLDSFGNCQRIDYGTGHELNFIIFCMGLYKLYLSKGELPCDKGHMKSVSEQFLRLFHCDYLPLCRKIQLTYRLEPAGSHGVFSLDDFQYLPFLFGSAELVHHNSLEPKDFAEQEVAARNASNFMFYAAIDFIFKVKTGPFYEHSNQLWNISGVDDWSKINRGLFKKYCDEVLNKFPIVQHLYFGSKVLPW